MEEYGYEPDYESVYSEEAEYDAIQEGNAKADQEAKEQDSQAQAEFEEEQAKLWLSAKKYRKKPIVIEAVQMKEAFTVPTKEGVMRGKAGDYLVKGIKGEQYPVDKEIIKLTYEVIQ